MTAFTAFLNTYWWIIPLIMMGFCFLTTRKGGICSGMWEGHQSDGSVLDILDRRYATGEIGRIEYEEKILTMGLRDRN
jgi:uncharacterized membrane protein